MNPFSTDGRSAFEQIRRLLAVTAAVVALIAITQDASAVVIQTADAMRHERFASGTNPNPTFLIDEALIRGIGVNSRAALITPRHYLTAAHSPSTSATFRDPTGTLRTFSTVSSVDFVTTDPDGTGTSDLRMYTIDDAGPLPTDFGIDPLAVFGGETATLVGREFFVYGNGARAGRNVIDDVQVVTFDTGARPTENILYLFDTDTNGGSGGLGGDEAGLQGGDSGYSALIDVDGTLAVIGPHFGIDVPDGTTVAQQPNYLSATTLATRYLDQIDAVTLAQGNFLAQRVSFTAVPEPSTAIALVGMFATWVARRRKQSFKRQPFKRQPFK